MGKRGSRPPRRTLRIDKLEEAVGAKEAAHDVRVNFEKDNLEEVNRVAAMLDNMRLEVIRNALPKTVEDDGGKGVDVCGGEGEKTDGKPQKGGRRRGEAASESRDCCRRVRSGRDPQRDCISK